MKASIQTVGKKVVLTVFYNPSTCDWNEAIATGLAAYGLKQGHVTVIAEPEKTLMKNEADNG
jgi:hypothetical protein